MFRRLFEVRTWHKVTASAIFLSSFLFSPPPQETLFHSHFAWYVCLAWQQSVITCSLICPSFVHNLEVTHTLQGQNMHGKIELSLWIITWMGNFHSEIQINTSFYPTGSFSSRWCRSNSLPANPKPMQTLFTANWILLIKPGALLCRPAGVSTHWIGFSVNDCLENSWGGEMHKYKGPGAAQQ